MNRHLVEFYLMEGIGVIFGVILGRLAGDGPAIKAGFIMTIISIILLFCCA